MGIILEIHDCFLLYRRHQGIGETADSETEEVLTGPLFPEDGLDYRMITDRILGRRNAACSLELYVLNHTGSPRRSGWESFPPNLGSWPTADLNLLPYQL